MITLIHPSRGRPDQALAAYSFWLANARQPQHIEHILSLDSGDPALARYVERFRGQAGSCLMVHDNSCVVEATNRAAAYARGDVLVYLSDDFKCPPGWDAVLHQAFARAAQPTPQPMMLKVDDCLQPVLSRVLTIPIMNRALYQALGYFWNPAYKSMFVDQDLFEVCFKHGWLVLGSGLKFPHEHPAIGKAADDDTYRRSSANWEQGKAVFVRRIQEGFSVQGAA